MTNLALYEDPRYWNGPLGYRPPGYCDFMLNSFRAAYISRLVAPGARILDVGCAWGYLVRRLRWRGYDAWGVEPSAYALAHAPSEVRDYLLQGTATAWPQQKTRFDFYVSCGVYEHLNEEQAEAALAMAARIAPRGLISLAVLDHTKPQHDDDGHDLLKPLDWWQQRMPDGFTVMDDDESAWLAVLGRKNIHIPTTVLLIGPDSPEASGLLQEFARRNYQVFQIAAKLLSPGPLTRFVVSGTAIMFDMSDAAFLARIEKAGAVAMVDYFIRETDKDKENSTYSTYSAPALYTSF